MALIETSTSNTRRTLVSINPANGQVLREFNVHSPGEIEVRLIRADEAFRRHRKIGFSQRAQWMRRAGEILEKEKADLGRMMTLEMGKPVRAAIQEVEKCALACQYYAEHAERYLREEALTEVSGRNFIRYQPLGAVLAVMPWNFPFWQVIRFAAPTLMAGNVGVLKHASNVPQCALALEDVFRRAGWFAGAFQTLLVASDRVPDLINDPRVKAVTVTGSLAAGASVAGLASKRIKKSVLELGGSDPFIVMPSADLEKAVATAVRARTINNGQSCIAAKRFIVHAKIAPDFEAKFVEGMAKLKVGDPLDEQTEVGPLATQEVLSGLIQQVNQSVRAGARLLLGGEPLVRPGYFYPPTVLTDVPFSAPARQDELFGPVATLIRVTGMEEALMIANETNFGLGASLWTEDPNEREHFIEEIEAGLAFVNGMVASHPALPFGGIKESGYGRELSYFGLREFVNIKTVCIAS